MDAVRNLVSALCALILVILTGTPLFAQEKFLARKISIDVQSCSLANALTSIGKEAGFHFSYDAGMISGDRQVRVRAKNSPVSTVLKEILGNDIRIREIGNHVILVKSRAASREKQSFSTFEVSGTILDAADNRPLGDVTIYEVQNNRSAVSEVNGVYRLVIPSGKKTRGLNFSKSGYADTVIFIREAIGLQADISLRRQWYSLTRLEALSATLTVNETDSMAVVRWLVPHETMVNAKNLEVRTSAMFQVSLIPYFGTNGKVTGSVANRFSLNLLAGYTGGLYGMEAGGLNITRNEVNGLQIGGAGNIVAGRGRGWQVGDRKSTRLNSSH